MSDLSCGTVAFVDGVTRLEEMAFLHGQSYDSYLSTDGPLKQFWLQDGTAVIPYVQRGRYIHTQGGLLGPVEQRPALLREFKKFLQRNRYRATFYNIGDTDLPLFREQAFQVTKWGEEPLLDVPEQTWAGRDFEWVRRQSNFCRRRGVVVSECNREDYSQADWAELMTEVQRIASDCLSTKPQRDDVTFFNGSVAPRRWDRRRLFVARADHGTGRIEGFLICLPFDAGWQYAIETYRHRLNAPRGVVPYLIQQSIECLKCEGIRTVSLCLCPAVRTEKLPGDSWIVRRCLELGFQYASAFFDMPGEYHFKSRFRPRFVRRFICHWPRATVRSMWSTVQLSGVLNLDLRRLSSKLWRRILRPEGRQNLATPDQRNSTPLGTMQPGPSESRSRLRKFTTQDRE